MQHWLNQPYVPQNRYAPATYLKEYEIIPVDRSYLNFEDKQHPCKIYIDTQTHQL